MNKSFILLDKNNNLQKNATVVVRFAFEGKDYLIYSIEENEQNSQIFVSKLVLNSEGKYFIDNIIAEEKGKLNNIVYNIVILLPSDAQKGNSFEFLSNGLMEKFSVKLSLDIPQLEVQEYYSICSVAITSKLLVDAAVKLYADNLMVVPVNNVAVPTWTAPVEVTAPMPTTLNESKVIEATVVPTPTIPVQEPVAVPSINLQTTPVVEPIINNMDVAVTTQPMPVNNVTATTPIVPTVSENTVQPNPQLEKMAVISDPSLGLGITQNNQEKNNNAGFANTKYIVIGTSCLVLAIAVVVTAFILISNL